MKYFLFLLSLKAYGRNSVETYGQYCSPRDQVMSLEAKVGDISTLVDFHCYRSNYYQFTTPESKICEIESDMCKGSVKTAIIHLICTGDRDVYLKIRCKNY